MLAAALLTLHVSAATQNRDEACSRTSCQAYSLCPLRYERKTSPGTPPATPAAAAAAAAVAAFFAERRVLYVQGP
jgi:hypothetical protein